MSKKFHILALSVVVISLLVYGASMASAALVGSTNVRLRVNPGSLSIVSQAESSMTAITLNGTDQTTPGSLGELTLVDARGDVTDPGWNVIIGSTVFTSTTGKTIPISPVGIDIEFRYTGISGLTTDFGNGPPAPQPPGPIPPSPGGIKILSAIGGLGMGQYRATPDLSLKIPAETYEGLYTAIVTETISTGP